MHCLPVEPLFYYCRHDHAAKTYARSRWPNNRPDPSQLFVFDGEAVYIFHALSGTAEAARIIDLLTKHYTEHHPSEPAARFVPVNARYWTLERLDADSAETAARLFRLMLDSRPAAVEQRRDIVTAWQRRELDHHQTHEDA